jgi:hypothetical protein
MLALAAVGGGCHTMPEAADARAYPMPGQLIDVGGPGRPPGAGMDVLRRCGAFDLAIRLAPSRG